MPAKFKTLGPFELTRKNGVLDVMSLREVWSGKSDIRYAVGIYIIATKRGKSFLPWYVGKSNRGFASRLGRHSVFEKLKKEANEGNLFLFLIAKVTSKTGILKRASRKHVAEGEDVRAYSEKLRSIDRLELALIGSCMAQNEKLLNLQEKIFLRSLVVPGFLNDSDEVSTDSSELLREMLVSNVVKKQSKSAQN